MEIDNLDIKMNFYKGLNERQRRHFLAIEAKAIGHGGINLISKTFKADRATVRRGLQELESAEALLVGRIRKEGGGRKKN